MLATSTASVKDVTEWILNKGYVVCAYPRKGEVVVNGFKRYKADKSVCSAVKHANKVKLNG